MQGITVRLTLAMLALVAALLLPTPRAGVAEAQQFDLEKAVTGAKTPADHEAIASYYDREGATAQAKATEHRKMEGKGQFKMEEHCQRLVQHCESIATDNAALAAAHQQMAREATQQKQ